MTQSPSTQPAQGGLTFNQLFDIGQPYGLSPAQVQGVLKSAALAAPQPAPTVEPVALRAKLLAALLAHPNAVRTLIEEALNMLETPTAEQQEALRNLTADGERLGLEGPGETIERLRGVIDIVYNSLEPGHRLRTLIETGAPSQTKERTDQRIYALGTLMDAEVARVAEQERERNSAPTEFLSPQDKADLQRLDELFSDNEGWDLPKERMQRLAELGVIRRTGGNHYQVTSFGMHCLDAEWGLPLRTVEQINADQAALAAQRNSPEQPTGEKHRTIAILGDSNSWVEPNGTTVHEVIKYDEHGKVIERTVRRYVTDDNLNSDGPND